MSLDRILIETLSQPYVVLAKGNVLAEDSILLDYVRFHLLSPYEACAD